MEGLRFLPVPQGAVEVYEVDSDLEVALEKDLEVALELTLAKALEMALEADLEAALEDFERTP